MKWLALLISDLEGPGSNRGRGANIHRELSYRKQDINALSEMRSEFSEMRSELSEMTWRNEMRNNRNAMRIERNEQKKCALTEMGCEMTRNVMRIERNEMECEAN
jgi:hypothetical protein